MRDSLKSPKPVSVKANRTMCKKYKIKKFEWNEKKNDWLKKRRHISFEEVEFSLKEGGLVDNTRNPNRKKYPKQKYLYY